MKSQDESKKTRNASTGKTRGAKKAAQDFKDEKAVELLEAQLEAQTESGFATNAKDEDKIQVEGESDAMAHSHVTAGATSEGKVIDLESGLSADEIQEAMKAEFGDGANATPAMGSSDGVVIEPMSENSESFDRAVEAGGVGRQRR